MKLAVVLAAVVGLVLLLRRRRPDPDVTAFSWRDLERVDSV